MENDNKEEGAQEDIQEDPFVPWYLDPRMEIEWVRESPEDSPLVSSEVDEVEECSDSTEYVTVEPATGDMAMLQGRFSTPPSKGWHSSFMRFEGVTFPRHRLSPETPDSCPRYLHYLDNLRCGHGQTSTPASIIRSPEHRLVKDERWCSLLPLDHPYNIPEIEENKSTEGLELSTPEMNEPETVQDFILYGKQPPNINENNSMELLEISLVKMDEPENVKLGNEPPKYIDKATGKPIQKKLDVEDEEKKKEETSFRPGVRQRSDYFLRPRKLFKGRFE